MLAYTIEPETVGTTDHIEKALAFIEKSWKKFTGEIHEFHFFRVEKLLYASFTDGFQRWEQLLANKLNILGKFGCKRFQFVGNV